MMLRTSSLPSRECEQNLHPAADHCHHAVARVALLEDGLAARVVGERGRRCEAPQLVPAQVAQQEMPRQHQLLVERDADHGVYPLSLAGAARSNNSGAESIRKAPFHGAVLFFSFCLNPPMLVPTTSYELCHISQAMRGILL